jgi:demethylmenaquinone methyltransferase/2-methoxy-6-polyprenyl-1,4-benzoquinol methylase
MPEPASVKSMFSRIAGRYDLANRLLSGGMDIQWRQTLVKAVREHDPRIILDLATGSGDVAFALAKTVSPAATVVGMDFCQPMLDEAEKKKQAAGSSGAKITFRQGDGMELPLAAGEFDAVTISFGLRNMADRHRSLTEMRRVLRPGGRLYILEFSQPIAAFRPFYFFYLRHLLPRIAGWVTKDRGAYEYLNRTIEAFPNRSALAAEIIQAGFSTVTHRGLTFGTVALHEAVN